jgi:methanogenic corrinoid protein MtbC1
VTVETLEEPRGRYLRAILDGDRGAALDAAFSHGKAGHPLVDVYVDVLQEALYEVGRLWETNRITVADEHMATAVTQYVMSRLYQEIPPAGTRRGRAVVTGVQGELHQLGANMVADALDSEGWNVMFLGADVPVEGVVETVARHRPELLGISSTMYFNLPKVVELVEAVRGKLGGSAPRVILGGGAFRTVRSLPPALAGCPVALDVRKALALTR